MLVGLRALRLHRNPQRNSSGDFAEGSFRVVGYLKLPSATRAAKHVQPLFVPHRGKRGSGGKLCFSLPPAGFAPLSTRESGLVEA